MDATLALWLLGGALALLIMMLAAVGVARTLARGHWPMAPIQPRPLAKAPGPAPDAAAKARGSDTLNAITGLIAAQLKEKDHAGEPKEENGKSKQAQALITGLAIAGGLLMLIVGLVTGDG